jgi:YHS domain-containing protein
VHIKIQHFRAWLELGGKQLARRKNKPTNFYLLVSVMLVLGGLAVATLVHQPSVAEAGLRQISDRSRICMLQDTVQARSGLAYVYHGKKYYLCCSGCLAAFKKDAARHSHATDRVDEKSVDKADAPAYAYQGHAYFFRSIANMTKFAGDPEKFVANASSQASTR